MKRVEIKIKMKMKKATPKRTLFLHICFVHKRTIFKQKKIEFRKIEKLRKYLCALRGARMSDRERKFYFSAIHF